MSERLAHLPLRAFFCLSHQRDYAASASLVDSIAEDLDVKKIDYGDLLYSLYLDDPNRLGGRQQRFACGILVDRKGADMKRTLMGMNKDIKEEQQTAEEEDLPAIKLWKRTVYESTSLPSVDAAVAQFPYTGGLVSALVLHFRVRPNSAGD